MSEIFSATTIASTIGDTFFTTPLMMRRFSQQRMSPNIITGKV